MIQAILMAYSCDRKDQARALANLFPNAEVVGRAFDARVKKYFDGVKVNLS